MARVGPPLNTVGTDGVAAATSASAHKAAFSKKLPTQSRVKAERTLTRSMFSERLLVNIITKHAVSPGPISAAHGAARSADMAAAVAGRD